MRIKELVGFAFFLPALCAVQACTEDHSEVKTTLSWVSLIPEDGLAGWETKHRDKYWKNEAGVIIGDNPDKTGSILWTEHRYGDYELVVEFMTESNDYDSGVFLRGETHQVQIGISRSLKKDLTGCLYCPEDGNGMYPLQADKKVIAAHKHGEWNNLHVIAKGKQIKTTLNGEKINEYIGEKFPENGKIGLQIHANVHQKMLFKTVNLRSIRE